MIIVGAGRVGLNLASFLTSDGHDVTVIENDCKLCDDAVHGLDALFISGNGTDKRVLEEVNLSDADVFIATTGNDGANLLTCLMAMKYNVPKIFARVSEQTHEKAFKQAGIDSVVSPELSAANHLKKIIINI